VGSNAQVALLIASPPRRNGAALDRSAHRPATAVASTRDTGTIHSWDPPMVGVGEGAVVPRPRQPCRPRAAPGPPGSSSPPSLHVLFAPMEHARPSPRCYVVVHPHVRSLAVCRRERVLPRNGELGGHYRAKRGATDMLLPSRMAKNEPDYPLSDRLLGVDTPCPPVTGRCARRPRYRRVGVPRGACPGAQAGPGGRRAPLLCRIGPSP